MNHFISKYYFIFIYFLQLIEIYHIYFCFRLLNCISNLTNSNNSKDLWSFLESVYNSKLPIKGLDLKINSDSGEEVIK